MRGIYAMLRYFICSLGKTLSMHYGIPIIKAHGGQRRLRLPMARGENLLSRLPVHVSTGLMVPRFMLPIPSFYQAGFSTSICRRDTSGKLWMSMILIFGMVSLL